MTDSIWSLILLHISLRQEAEGLNQVPLITPVQQIGWLCFLKKQRLLNNPPGRWRTSSVDLEVQGGPVGLVVQHQSHPKGDSSGMFTFTIWSYLSLGIVIIKGGVGTFSPLGPGSPCSPGNPGLPVAPWEKQTVCSVPDQVYTPSKCRTQTLLCCTEMLEWGQGQQMLWCYCKISRKTINIS